MTPYDQAFPGTVLSTGMEDFFDSSYGFSGGGRPSDFAVLLPFISV